MPEVVFKNVSSSPTIAAVDSGQYKLLYTPSTKNTVPLDGFVADLKCFAKVRSVSELINAKPVPTEEKPYFSESEIEQYQYNLISLNTNYKALEIYTSESLAGEKSYKFSIPAFNRKPHLEIDLHSRLTKNAYLQIPANFCIWGKVNNLVGDDIFSFWISAYEEGVLDVSDIGMLKEDFYTINLQGNVLAQFDFPNGTQGYSFKCRSDAPVSNIAWAWQQSALTENKYDYLPAYSEESAWIFPSLNKSLFLRSESNCTVIIKLWKKQ